MYWGFIECVFYKHVALEFVFVNSFEWENGEWQTLI
jgi:hypothetical protein